MPRKPSAKKTAQTPAKPVSTSPVTLLLRGGHRWLCDPGPDGAVIRDLEAQLERPDDGTVFHLRSPDGQWLAVPAREIVGMVQAPAIIPYIREDKSLPGSPFLLVDDFLEEDDRAAVLDFALAREADYTAATVTTAAADYRRAQVLFDLAGILPLFRPRIEALLPAAWARLDLAPVPVGAIESQLTAHGDGDYFKRHNDNGSPATAARIVSYVYYFYRAPKSFSGGALRIFDTVVAEGFYKCGERSAEVEPRANSLIMFPSHCHHEVTPVHCATPGFADRRFTLNGWIVRAP